MNQTSQGWPAQLAAQYETATEDEEYEIALKALSFFPSELREFLQVLRQRSKTDAPTEEILARQKLQLEQVRDSGLPESYLDECELLRQQMCAAGTAPTLQVRAALSNLLAEVTRIRQVVGPPGAGTPKTVTSPPPVSSPLYGGRRVWFCQSDAAEVVVVSGVDGDGKVAKPGSLAHALSGRKVAVMAFLSEEEQPPQLPPNWTTQLIQVVTINRRPGKPSS